MIIFLEKKNYAIIIHTSDNYKSKKELSLDYKESLLTISLFQSLSKNLFKKTYFFIIRKCCCFLLIFHCLTTLYFISPHMIFSLTFHFYLLEEICSTCTYMLKSVLYYETRTITNKLEASSNL